MNVLGTFIGNAVKKIQKILPIPECVFHLWTFFNVCLLCQH